MKITEALNNSYSLLSNVSKTYKLDAEVLLAHVLNKKNRLDVYLDLNQLPLKSENFFHFLQYFISNNLNLTIFSNHSLDIKFSNSEIIPDTLSRLKSFTSVSIDPPQDELLFLLVEKFLKKKSISVQPKIIFHIIKFIERTYEDALRAADVINHLLYENNHNINLSLISEYYEQI